MFRCDDCQDRLLDYQYGLLDAADAAGVAAHLAGCPACAAALAQADKWRGLIALAAKAEFPDVTFTPPTEPAVLPSPERPARDRYAHDPRPTVRRAWVSWAVAASLFLITAGLGGPAVRDAAGWLAYMPRVQRETADLQEAKRNRDAAEAAYAEAKDRDTKRLAAARKAHDAVVEQWTQAEQRFVTAAAERPFSLLVQGPASAVPGAPNDYAVRAVDKAGLAITASVEARVTDAAGKVVFEKAFPADGRDKRVRVPAAAWDGLTPGAQLFLHVSAQDARGATTKLSEAIRLLEPVLTTVVATDKPLYRPGETIYFRSLTLDRARFLPPDRELHLQFVLKGPDGRPVQSVNGLAKPATEKGHVLGPDGKPVRGVGAGAFALPKDAAGGVYTLEVSEVVAVGGVQSRLASRSVTVHNFKTDDIEKTLDFDARTYGPGDPVSAKLTVRDQGEPVAGAEVEFSATADGRKLVVTPAVARTDATGSAAVRFTLPAGDEVTAANVSARVLYKAAREALDRPVPVASRRVTVEFFPEGGDLVPGVPNRVYFRATTSAGKPADVAGVLTADGRTIGDIRTLTDADRPGVNQGLGVFTLTPEAGKRYAVRLDRPAGAVQLATPFAGALGAAAALPLPAYELPRAKRDGVLLTVPDGVTRPGEKVRVGLYSATKRTVLVGAYTRGRPAAHQRATLEPGKATELALDFGDSRLGGVTRVTVFEERAGAGDLVPVAERLVFRQPVESLKLAFTTNATGPAFLPGDAVELRVAATDEAGRPKPAILWAAVVNQGVVAMADEKTARLLPTHFLLGGEVQKGDELEHADFLLTDHPKAAAALDLVLGTQGWRRFAEQGAMFNKEASPDLERLQVASTGGAVPGSWRTEARRVVDEYWPKYEAALFDLERVERDVQTGESRAAASRDVTNAQGRYNGHLSGLGTAAADIEVFDKSARSRKDWFPVTLVVVVGLGVLCLVGRYAGGRAAPERRPLGAGAVGFGLLAALLLAVVGVTNIGGDEWRGFAQVAPKPTNPNQPWMRSGPAPGGGAETPDAPERIMGDGMRKGGPPRENNKNKQASVVKPLGVAKPALPRPAGFEKRDIPAAKDSAAAPPALEAERLIREELDRRRRAAIVAGNELPPAEVQAFERVVRSLPAAPPLVVREYAHAHGREAADEPRSDFTETLLWQPVIVLPDDGKATLKFDLSDAVAGYQVLVAGHTLDGRLGATVGTIGVRQALAADPKLPREVSSADKIDAPVRVTNATPREVGADVTVTADGLKVEGDPTFTLGVPAADGRSRVVRLVPTVQDGPARVRVSASAPGGLTDAIDRTLVVVPDGFPAQGGKSDLLEERARLPIELPPQWIPGTLRVTVTLYPSTLSELQAGLEGLLREPSGCFEQSSTTNYPNVLVMEYLKETNQANPDVSRRAHELMARGYARLTGYECPKTGSPTRLGYEWFGAADRPHEALTAYGLLQFTDMSRVYPVDGDMLRRTKQFLIDSRDGAGGFTRNARALDSFGRAPDHVTNAYIVWAVTEAERGAADRADLSKELAALVELTKTQTDPYFLSLVANALLNRGKQADGVAVLTTVAKAQAKDGRVAGGATSITGSAGRGLDVETTALAVLGFLKANRPEQFGAATHAAVKWIGAQRQGGTFGATQSTILALKALVEHARANKRPAESGELRVFLGPAEVERRAFTTAQSGPVIVELPADGTFKPGRTEVRVETTARQAYPVSVAWSCRTRQPASSPDCAVTVSAKLAKAEVSEGESVRLDVAVENVTDTGRGMAVAVVGLPAGLKLPEDARQLKALTEGPDAKVSYWETRGRELILYWRGLAPKQKVALGLDLIADVPGEYRGPASRAYLYYDADHKHWAAPVDVRIVAR